MTTALGNELTEKLQSLKATCTDLGIPLVEAGINGLLDTYHLDLDETDFLALLPHEKPSAVFYETVAYDPERFIRGTMMGHGWKESWEKDPELYGPSPMPSKPSCTRSLSRLLARLACPGP